MSTGRDNRMLRPLAVAALVLGILAPFGGSPYRARHGAIDVAALAHTVAREEDHVTALELAQWIKDRRPGLRVLDVRSAEEYAAFHIPKAEHMPIDSLTAIAFRADETLVLYSEGGTHAAQAWVFLRALGNRNVYFLRGGLYEWLEQVMNPTLADTSAGGRAAFAHAAVLSRYFGGVPRSDLHIRPSDDDAIRLPKRGDSTQSAVPLPKHPVADRLLQVRRRGC